MPRVGKVPATRQDMEQVRKMFPGALEYKGFFISEDYSFHRPMRTTWFQSYNSETKETKALREPMSELTIDDYGSEDSLVDAKHAIDDILESEFITEGPSHRSSIPHRN